MARTAGCITLAILAIADQAAAQSGLWFEQINLVIDELMTPTEIAIAPDGIHAYILAPYTVYVCDRDETTGDLTRTTTVHTGFGDTSLLNDPAHLVFSPGGEHAYVGDADGANLIAFARDTSTGSLNQIAAYEVEDVGGIAISPDGNTVYATSTRLESLFILDRDSTTGELSEIQRHVNGIAGITGMQVPKVILVSPDSEFVYVHAKNSFLVKFDRDLSTGELTPIGFEQGDNFLTDILISPDGLDLYSAHNNDTGRDVDLAHYSLDPETGDLSLQSTLSFPSNGLAFMAMSSDGATLYVVSAITSRMTTFTRNGATGALTEIEATNQQFSPEFNGRSDIAISPGDGHAYIATQQINGIATLDRDGTSGLLTYSNTLTSGPTDPDALGGAKYVAISPDGLNAYVASSDDSSLSVFDIDPLTDEWTFIQKHIDGQGANGLREASAVTISADGAHVYGISPAEHTVALFTRDPSTGLLTFIEVERNLNDGVIGLNGANFGAVSPDGNHLYVTAGLGSSVVIFSRDIASGELTYVDTVFDEVDGVTVLSLARELAISPDGNFVYVVAEGDKSIAIFSRDALTGTLDLIGAVIDDVDGVDRLNKPSAIAMSPNGDHVYVSSLGNTLNVFDRDSVSGLLTLKQELVKNPENGVRATRLLQTVRISPDGKWVVTGGGQEDMEVAGLFKRDPNDGTLRELEVHGRSEEFEVEVENTRGIRLLEFATFSPNSAHFHIASPLESTVATCEIGVVPAMSGTVSEISTGEPIPCAAVILTSHSELNPSVQTAVTDANGRFMFDELGFEVHDVLVVAPGFQDIVGTPVTPAADKHIRKNYRMPTADDTAPITGVVRDAATLNPIPGARVSATVNGDEEITTYTCADGSYELRLASENKQSNSFSLTFDSDGYTSMMLNVDVEPDTSETVNMDLNASQATAGSISVLVHDSEMTPLENATVTVRGTMNATLWTDSTGAASVPLPDGAYTIRASGEGYSGQSAIRSILNGTDAHKAFDLEAGVDPIEVNQQDANGDGTVNSQDIQAVINGVLGLLTGFDTDIDGNGVSNAVDVQMIINDVLGL